MTNQELLYSAFGLVVLLVLVLQSFWLYKSVPPQYVDRIFTDAKKLAAETSTPLDDLLVNSAEMVVKNVLVKPAEEVEKKEAVG